jgi:hypothetical protein
LIDGSKEIPGYCYIICDITPEFRDYITIYRGFKPTVDKKGYWSNDNDTKTYIEFIPYDKLIRQAKERNQAFFAKLGADISI